MTKTEMAKWLEAGLASNSTWTKDPVLNMFAQMLAELVSRLPDDPADEPAPKGKGK